MLDTFDTEPHPERFSAFDLKRVTCAKAQAYDAPVTGYLTNAYIVSCCAIGVVSSHRKNDVLGRFADGHLIRTSDIKGARKEGRFWVLTTMNSRYVVATFKREMGRASLMVFLDFSSEQRHQTPRRLQ